MFLAWAFLSNNEVLKLTKFRAFAAPRLVGADFFLAVCVETLRASLSENSRCSMRSREKLTHRDVMNIVRKYVSIILLSSLLDIHL